MGNPALDRKAMLQKIMERSNQKKGANSKDPFEWKPPQLKKTDPETTIKCFFLWPVEKGDKVQGGTAKVGMDGCYFFKSGDHWIEKKRIPCPRCYDDKPCPFCKVGFDLLNETDDKKARSEISKTYLPQSKWVVNVYFPPGPGVPKELHDKVFYWGLPKTVFTILDQTANREDDGGDPDNPKAFGPFFEPEDSYPFLLTIQPKGEFNDYTLSKFIPRRQPIAVGKDGKPDAKKIEEILSRRHDIPARFPVRDEAVVKLLEEHTRRILKGANDGPSDDGFDASEAAAAAETLNESIVEEKPKPKPVQVKAPAPAAKPAAAPAAAKAPVKAPTPAAKPAAAPAATKAPVKAPAPAAKSAAAPAAKAPAKPVAKAPVKPAPKVEEPVEETPAEEAAETTEEVAEAVEETTEAEAVTEETTEAAAEETTEASTEETSGEVAETELEGGGDEELNALLNDIRKGNG